MADLPEGLGAATEAEWAQIKSYGDDLADAIWSAMEGVPFPDGLSKPIGLTASMIALGLTASDLLHREGDEAREAAISALVLVIRDRLFGVGH